MAVAVSTVTRKGQVTLPVDIRKALGIKQGDKVAFEMDDEGVARLTRQDSFTARTAGIVKTSRPPMSAEEMRRAAEEAIADGASERSGG